MGGLEGISPTWVQAGELGFAFIVVILVTVLVIYVMRKNDEREQRYIKIINEFTPLFADIRSQLTDIKEDLRSAVGSERKKPREKGLFSSAD